MSSSEDAAGRDVSAARGGASSVMAGRLQFALLRIIGTSIDLPMMGRSRGFFVFARRRAGMHAGATVWLFLLCRWHPRYAFVLHALPLCGAAPTFLCRRKEK